MGQSDSLFSEEQGAERPDFYFSSCSEVRSSGRTVLKTVKEGYRPELDENKNGIACDE